MSGDDEGPWPTGREEVAYTEARAVLDAQHSDLCDIDDKALRTVRITAILIGVAATGVQFVEPADVNGWAFFLGGGFLLASLGMGVLTYTESNLVLGPDAEFIEQLARNEFEDEPWNQDLLTSMGTWIEENHEVVSWNQELLTITQSSLVLGLTLLVLSVVI